MAQLVIVSNRVSVPDEGGTRAGGLEVAVKAALKRMSGIWFGWSGRVTPRKVSAPTTCVGAPLTKPSSSPW